MKQNVFMSTDYYTHMRSHLQNIKVHKFECPPQKHFPLPSLSFYLYSIYQFSKEIKKKKHENEQNIRIIKEAEKQKI